MPRIEIDSESFEAASTVFGKRIATQVTDALNSLVGHLSDSGAMAGSDEAGTNWAASYDQSARLAVEGMTDLGNACYQLAGLLQQTGFNHGSAENASTAGGSAASVDRTSYAGLSMNCYATPPSASGGSSSPPTGWGLVQHLVGYAWPNGHQDKLNSAAAAWNDAATTLSDTAYYTTEAYDAIAGQRSPEVNDATRVCSAMEQHITDMASSCRQIATGCTDLATHIDTAHSQIESELVSLVEWTAGIEAGSFVVGLFTFGGGDAVAQGVEAGRIAATARRIASIIEALIGAARTVAESVTAVLSRIGTVVERIKPLLGARASAVVLEDAGALPVIARGTEEVAVDGLTSAAESNAADDALYQMYVDGKRAKGLTPRSRQAWQNKLDSLRRNKAVGDAYRDQVAEDLGIKIGEDGWTREFPVKGLGRVFDIANEDQLVGIEVKSGSTGLQSGLTQMAKDEAAVRQGWTITWQLKTDLNPTLMARLQELAAKYPGKFNYSVAGG